MKKTLFKDAHYYTTGLICPECGSLIYQEMTSDGKLVDHFSCLERTCTYTSIPENIETIYKKSELSHERGIRPVLPEVIEVDMGVLEKRVLDDYKDRKGDDLKPGNGGYGNGAYSPEEADFNGI